LVPRTVLHQPQHIFHSWGEVDKRLNRGKENLFNSLLQ